MVFRRILPAFVRRSGRIQLKPLAVLAINNRNNETYNIFTNMRRVLFSAYEKSVDLSKR
jgi:hypothetical protein